MTQESTSHRLRHRHHRRHGSKFAQWLYRVRNSGREKRRLRQELIIIVIVIIAFVIGFYYFGPSFSSTEAG